MSNDEGNVEFLEVYYLGNQLKVDEHVVTGTAEFRFMNSDVIDDLIITSLHTFAVPLRCVSCDPFGFKYLWLFIVKFLSDPGGAELRLFDC